MSTVKHLFNIAVDLKVTAQEHEVWLYMCHISGDRMILTGVDGGSRGNDDAGVLVGRDVREFIPFDKSPFELAGDLLTKWFGEWMKTDYSKPLDPIGWFTRAHLPGVYLWAPSPAAALIVLKQLARSRQKRPHQVTHVFVCQRLLWQEEWKRRLAKEMDLWFILYPGQYWPHENCEPLIIGISFPMSNSKVGPWLVLQDRDKVVETGRALSEMSKTCHVSVRNYLRELWAHPRTFPPLPRSVVR